MFLGSDDPEDIIRLIEQYPEFKAMYQQIYELCENVEDMMGLFSKELARMDENTVTYMMDELQDEIDKKIAEIEKKTAEIDQQKVELAEKDSELQQKDAELQRQNELIKQQQEMIAHLNEMLKKQQ